MAQRERAAFSREQMKAPIPMHPYAQDLLVGAEIQPQYMGYELATGEDRLRTRATQLLQKYVGQMDDLAPFFPTESNYSDATHTIDKFGYDDYLTLSDAIINAYNGDELARARGEVALAVLAKGIVAINGGALYDVQDYQVDMVLEHDNLLLLGARAVAGEDLQEMAADASMEQDIHEAQVTINAFTVAAGTLNVFSSVVRYYSSNAISTAYDFVTGDHHIRSTDIANIGSLSELESDQSLPEHVRVMYARIRDVAHTENRVGYVDPTAIPLEERVNLALAFFPDLSAEEQNTIRDSVRAQEEREITAIQLARNGSDQAAYDLRGQVDTANATTAEMLILPEMRVEESIAHLEALEPVAGLIRLQAGTLGEDQQHQLDLLLQIMVDDPLITQDQWRTVRDLQRSTESNSTIQALLREVGSVTVGQRRFAPTLVHAEDRALALARIAGIPAERIPEVERSTRNSERHEVFGHDREMRSERENIASIVANRAVREANAHVELIEAAFGNVSEPQNLLREFQGYSGQTMDDRAEIGVRMIMESFGIQEEYSFVQRTARIVKEYENTEQALVLAQLDLQVAILNGRSTEVAQQTIAEAQDIMRAARTAWEILWANNAHFDIAAGKMIEQQQSEEELPSRRDTDNDEPDTVKSSPDEPTE